MSPCESLARYVASACGRPHAAPTTEEITEMFMRAHELLEALKPLRGPSDDGTGAANPDAILL